MVASRFAVPEWFVPGAHDRTIPVGEIPGVPMFVEANPVIPEKDWLDALRDPNRPQLRKRVWTIIQQKGGSCAAASVSSLGMLVRAAQGRRPVLFNELGVYGRVNGGRDGGSGLDKNIAFARKFGLFPEEAWPRSNGWSKTPSDAAYEAASHFKLQESYDINNSSYGQFFAEFFSSIMLGNPVQFGYPGHAISAVDIVEEAKATRQMIESADVMDQWLVSKGFDLPDNPTGGLIDSLYIEYLNTWGANWGDHGFGWIRANRVERRYGAYSWRAMVECEWTPPSDATAG